MQSIYEMFNQVAGLLTWKRTVDTNILALIRMQSLNQHMANAGTIVLTALVDTPCARKFNVSTPGFAFTIDDLGNNPTIYLFAGHSYMFSLNTAGHPFIIRETNGSVAVSSGIKYVDSFTGDVTTGSAANSGKTSGFLLWTVPYTMTSAIYQCTAHPSMVGTIGIINPANIAMI